MVEGRRGLARYEKAKRNRQGFASLAVLLRPGWFQAMGRDGGQPGSQGLFLICSDRQMDLAERPGPGCQARQFPGLLFANDPFGPCALFAATRRKVWGALLASRSAIAAGLLALERYASPKVHRQRQSRYRPSKRSTKSCRKNATSRI
jgi:hypothetical protein